MRKFLSLIIPHYTETEREMFPLLSSIAGQVGIDFQDVEVLIATDGGGRELNHDFIQIFDPIKVEEINLLENGGPGVARQAGLDAANGEYVMFCDADDTLHNVGVLGALMQEAEQSAPDILTSSWLEEIEDERGAKRYVEHPQENTWMHGKLLRRAFLQQNNIRFHPELRVHEDSYFLCIAQALSERSRHLPITSYVWKFRRESITRRDGAAYSFNAVPTFIRACTLAHREVEKKKPEQMEYKVLQFTLYNYFCFHQARWLAPEHAAYLRDGEAAFAEYIAPEWHYWLEANPETIAEIYNQERARSFAGEIEKETLDMWLERMGLPLH